MEDYSSALSTTSTVSNYCMYVIVIRNFYLIIVKKLNFAIITRWDLLHNYTTSRSIFETFKSFI